MTLIGKQIHMAVRGCWFEDEETGDVTPIEDFTLYVDGTVVYPGRN